MKCTLHIEGAGVDSSWLPAGVSSIVSGILVTRCGGVHLRTHANGEKLKSDAPTSNSLEQVQFQWQCREREGELGGDNPFSFSSLETIGSHYPCEATRWQEGVCWLTRQHCVLLLLCGGTGRGEAAAMPCWAQRRLESQSTVSTSPSLQGPL